MIILLVQCLLFAEISFASNILFITPLASYSHQIFFRPIVFELLNRNHHVTHITTDPIAENRTNLLQISVHELYDIAKLVTKKSPKKLNAHEHEQSNVLYEHLSITKIYGEKIFENKQIQQLIEHHDKYHFDLVVMEWKVLPLAAFAELFDCPIVALNSVGSQSQIDLHFRNPVPLMFSTDVYVPYVQPMGIIEKFDNIYFLLKVYYNLWTKLKSINQDMYEKYFYQKIKRTLPLELDSILDKRSSLVLMNRHPVFSYPTPSLPNVIDIGGLHNLKSKTLPRDLQEILDRSIEGAVYISFGTNIPVSSIEQRKLQVLLEIFKELPYQFLWKVDSGSNFALPENVVARKWFPQNDILRHPNVKCFITQAGLQSVEESIHARTPMIGIPLSGDQHFVANRINQLKIGVKLFYNTLDKNTLNDSIQTVITSKIYKENIEKLANIYEDQIVPPLNKTIWWIEHVIRHNGANYLKSPTIKLSWFEFYMIDVALILILVLLAIIVVLYYILRKIKAVVCNKAKIKTE